MPVFKLSYVDESLSYAAIKPSISISALFTIEEGPTTGNLDVSLPSIYSLFEVAVTHPIVFPLPTVFMEAVEDQPLRISVSPVVRIGVYVEPLNEARLSVKIRPALYFDVLNFIYAGIDLTIAKTLSRITLYHPLFAKVSARTKPARARFTIEHTGANELKIGLPSINVAFDVFSDLSEASFYIKIPTGLCRLRLLEENLVDEASKVIMFEYEKWMYEYLKSLRPQYPEEDIINFQEGGEE